jgi:hypothetical protein
MKFGATASMIAHTMVLSWGLLTITSPKPFNVADVEALPVDIIPIEALTKTVLGDKKAPVAETAAPKPTKKPKIEKPAVNVGSTQFDTKSSKNTEKSPKPVLAAAPPKSQPEAKVNPKPVSEDKPEESNEKVPVPTTELAVEPQEKVKVAAIDPQEPSPVTKQAEALPQEEFKKLPDLVPTPRLRPATAKAKVAKTNERKKADKPASQVAKAAPKSKSKKEADEIAALLNRQDPTASGAKSSTKRAALGAKKTTGSKLSQSEMDALRGKIQGCFNLTAGMADADELRATVKVKLTPSGELEGKPLVTASGGNASVRRAFKGAARRAVQKCAPYDNLPKDKYQTWADLVVNFDVSDML